ncbi:MAG: adenine phosphoribosyltransferase [Prevotellaceae bacterium]|jgi:adenine phosphoribosyltransferase|nr:adenine phosphoribosyltransferase [Prevotellaceae bacterium]
MDKNYFKQSIRKIPDFPQKGIVFLDLTTAFKDPKCLRFISDSLVDLYKDKGITKVLGIESRGFIAGASLAEKLDAGFVPIRKKGKLPADSYEVSYDLEYGSACIEIHKDAIGKDDVVLIHDDLLATGGTMQAAIELVKMFHVEQIYVNFLVELDFLNGRTHLPADVKIDSLIHF